MFPTKRERYWFLTAHATFLILPLWLNLGLVLSPVIIGIPLLLALPYVIYRFGKKADLPESFLSRYGPFIAPILLTLVVWLIIAAANGGDFINLEESDANYGLLAFLPFFVFGFFALYFNVPWLVPVVAIASYLLFMACFAIGTRQSGRFRTTEERKAIPVLALTLVLVFAAIIQGYAHSQLVLPKDVENELGEWVSYQTPITPPSLRIDRDYPKLDGAPGLSLIYAAAVEAIYREDRKSGAQEDELMIRSESEKAVSYSDYTSSAYQALLDGKADMIFAFAPSEEQITKAAEQGIAYTLTPIARDAFVFVVNAQNPVKGLTIAQIRDIYSGKIDYWWRVGGTFGRIMAFQHGVNYDEYFRSEAITSRKDAMLHNIMRGRAMRKPLVYVQEERFSMRSSGPSRRISNYRNLEDAIGYTFRSYVTDNSDIRMLAVDGIAPTVENIQNGSYPFIEDIYIVTARPLSENAQKLRDWFVSDEGQRFIAEVGYVPIKGNAHY